MRWRSVAALVLAACSAARPPAPLPHPAAAPDTVEVAARALEPVGGLRVVEVAITSEHPQKLAVDRRQVFARIEGTTPGAQPQPDDVAGFEDRALPSTELRAGSRSAASSTSPPATTRRSRSS